MDDNMNLQEQIRKVLKEEISSKDAYSEYGSIKTVVDGKRDVAFTTLYNPMSKLMVLINGLKKIKVVSDDAVNYIVYREGAEDKAEELFRIANKYGGLLHYEATDEDSRRIGQLLNYNTKEIEDYIKHNRNTKNKLKESISKVLKEERTEKIIKIIGEYIKTFYPKFNNNDADYDVIENGYKYLITTYYDPEDGSFYAKYREQQKELQLSRTMFNELEGTFGDDMDYVVDWFNNEFGENAEYVTI
jgi:hypothetical protein